MKNNKVSMMSGLRNSRAKLFIWLLVVTLVLIVINLVAVNIHSAEDQIYIQKASDLRVLSQEIAKNSSEAIAGSDSAFVALKQSRAEFQLALNLISTGQSEYVNSGIGILTSLPGRAESINEVQPLMENLWSSVRSNVDVVLNSQEQIYNLNEIAASVSESIPQLQRNYDEVVNSLLDSGESLSTIAVAQRQAWLSERIALNLNRIVSGNDNAELAVEQLQRDINLFFSNHESLLEGDVSIGVNRVTDSLSREGLEEITALFSIVEEQTSDILLAAPEIINASRAVDTIGSVSEQLLLETTGLSQFFNDSRGDHFASPLVGYALLLAILVIISLYGVDVISQSRSAARVSADENARNNEAVLNLLEEISDLADGDLTVEATVSENFTGAIADSINYAIAQLRDLVSAITDVTVQVNDSITSSQETVQYLSDASSRQTTSITSVSQSVRDMESSINDVSNNARKSLDVAKKSVEIATGGGDVVKSTISGMDTIREQIQETAKRIKRLGESSQEIGGFVSLINDIADHTNTLSLNAAIQAAMAGDAGKGFGVVADEVHALAVRSTDATRQIEALVKVIQRDINEAVFSMEQTTSDVVKGTKLAQEAGGALDDIENVSKELADLVENITTESGNQAKTASQITNSMGVIQKITTETSSGTEATSEFMTNLTSLTGNLNNAVAGFSLLSDSNNTNSYSYEEEISDLDTIDEFTTDSDVDESDENYQAA